MYGIGMAVLVKICSALAARSGAASPSVGFFWSMRATMPATCGDAMDVPPRKKKLVRLL
jgi:hypothetical protein